MTACMFHVTNLTPPGSECNPPHGPPISNNQNEQFHYFTSLVAYLLKLAGRTSFQPPAQFDDPNAAWWGCTS
jgi:hypothetical protein